MSYVSIRVSTLRGDQKIDFDAYIKINDKMVHYLRRGDSFEGERLKRLKEKKLRKMFILAEDEINYLAYMKKNIEIAYDKNSTKDIQSRAEIVQGSQQGNTEEVFENPDDAVAYSSAKDAAGQYVDFIMSNSQALTAVMKIENTDKNVAHHGVAVATLAISLAQKLGISDPNKTKLLTLGSLLHDYGHHNSSLNLSQPLLKMNTADKALWNKHPKDGVAKVQHTQHFDQTVLNIILQHEEKINGSGPLKMFEKDIDPLAVIVSAANTVDRMMTFEGVPKSEVGKTMMVESIGKYPLQYIQNLNDFLKGL